MIFGPLERAQCMARTAAAWAKAPPPTHTETLVPLHGGPAQSSRQAAPPCPPDEHTVLDGQYIYIYIQTYTHGCFSFVALFIMDPSACYIHIYIYTYIYIYIHIHVYIYISE